MALLSQISNTSITEYKRTHTLLGFGHLWFKHTPAILTIDRKMMSSVTIQFRPLRNGAFYCSQCAAEQIKKYGVSLWLTEHQVAGIDWCTKHSQLLSLVNDPFAYEHLPSEYLGDPEIFTENELCLSHYNDNILHYSDVIHFLMANEINITEMMCSTLTELIFSKHLNRRFNDLKYIVKFLRDSFPGIWLNENFPELLFLEQAGFSLELLPMFSHGPNVFIALICAATFNNIESSVGNLYVLFDTLDIGYKISLNSMS